jgi:hypothetical protein
VDVGVGVVMIWTGTTTWRASSTVSHVPQRGGLRYREVLASTDSTATTFSVSRVVCFDFLKLKIFFNVRLPLEEVVVRLVMKGMATTWRWEEILIFEGRRERKDRDESLPETLAANLCYSEPDWATVRSPRRPVRTRILRPRWNI